MKDNFEDWLMEYFAKTEPHTDDLLPELFENWLTGLDVQDVIDLANEWAKPEESINKYKIPGYDETMSSLDKLTIRKVEK